LLLGSPSDEPPADPHACRGSLAGAALALVLTATPAAAVSGGARAAIADAPYIAWLPEGCTGTLIAPDRILTAGHCLPEFTPVGFLVGDLVIEG
jgi:hypothetical protein